MVRETGTPGFMLTLRVLAVSVPLASVLLAYVCQPTNPRRARRGRAPSGRTRPHESSRALICNRLTRPTSSDARTLRLTRPTSGAAGRMTSPASRDSVLCAMRSCGASCKRERGEIFRHLCRFFLPWREARGVSCVQPSGPACARRNPTTASTLGSRPRTAAAARSCSRSSK